MEPSLPCLYLLGLHHHVRRSYVPIIPTARAGAVRLGAEIHRCFEFSAATRRWKAREKI